MRPRRVTFPVAPPGHPGPSDAHVRCRHTSTGPPGIDRGRLDADNRAALMPRGNQLERQWRLLQLIDRPAGITVADAARELGCVQRTIWRDLVVLQRATFPIYNDKQADRARSACLSL